MNEIISADSTLPQNLLLIQLSGKPIFPGIFTPVMITNKEDIEVVSQALSTDKMIGLILKKEDEEPPFYEIGTVARIVKKINLPDGGYNIFISTLKRFKINKIITHKSPYFANVSYLDDTFDGDKTELNALTRALISDMKELSEGNPLFSEEMRLNMVNIDNPGKVADFITSILNLNRKQQQAILEIIDIRERIQQVLIYIRKEQELLKIQKKVSQQINERIETNQREYFLREELKAIRNELGETVDPKTSDYNKFKKILDKISFDEESHEQIYNELEKFATMDPAVAEYTVTKNYLEIITKLPWEEPKPDAIDLAKAQKILDKDHYGLSDVKERIIEYLAVRKLKNDSKGSIICLVGPPGVGKTSIGKSIASTLNRKFFRFSMGGMRDEAEIKGHRRTYVGAMPGKIIQGLKITKSKASVFLLDEIDKVGNSYHGDPSSALLEVLDPEQNTTFRDHYLDLPFNLSNILFITTANTLDTIPPPLLDRMEIIRLSAYIDDEKIEIAHKYLVPKSVKKHGLTKKVVRYNKSTLKTIAENYARDAGMRSYEKILDKINRKVAQKVVEGQEEYPITITSDSLQTYLGQPSFDKGEKIVLNQPGMNIGLAWTNFGGDIILIEAIALSGKGELKLTGRMGDTMKESASISYSVARNYSSKFDIDPTFFTKNNIHLHIPEGGTPKDGPSAGITMAIALLSLAMGKKVNTLFAMTGELSLTEKVLPIGGLREKVIASRRNGINKIIFPKKNMKDWEEIPENIKKNIEIFPVSTFKEVVDLLLNNK